MNLLSDEQRQELKTLPAWFLSRLKEEVAAKKDADQALEAEQQRLEKFNQLVADWQKDQEAQKASTFGALQERLDTTLAEVQRWADEEKKKQGSVYRVLDDQYEAKKQELADTEKKMNARKDQITLLKKEIEHLGDLTREKKAKSMFGLSDKKPRTVSMNPRRGSAVRKRLNSLAIGQLPAGVVPPVQVRAFVSDLAPL
jgi:chromosome segregation ATPase